MWGLPPPEIGVTVLSRLEWVSEIHVVYSVQVFDTGMEVFSGYCWVGFCSSLWFCLSGCTRACTWVTYGYCVRVFLTLAF